MKICRYFIDTNYNNDNNTNNKLNYNLNYKKCQDRSHVSYNF